MQPRQLAGILWLTSVVTVFISLLIVIVFDVSTLNPNVETTLRKIAENTEAHLVELIFDIFSGIALVAAAAPLYRTFSEADKTLALTGSLLFVGYGIIIAAHDMENLALAWVATAFVEASATEAATLALIGESMILTAKWGVPIFSVFLLLGAFVYSILLVATQLARWVGWLGIAGGAFGLIAVPLQLIDPTLEEVSFLLFVPFLIWQFVFGGFLLTNKSLDGVANSANVSFVDPFAYRV